MSHGRLHLNVGNAHPGEDAAVTARLPEPLAALLLEYPDLRSARFAVNDAEHLGIGDKRRAREDVAGVFLDEQDLVEGHLAAGFAGIVAVDGDDGARLDAELAVIDKRRSEDGTAEVMNVIGEVANRTCVIADDIIDTAGTIQKAAQALKSAGADRVLACAIHGVLSGPAIDRIEKSPIDKLIITNTIPLTAERAKCQKIVVLSVARLLGQAIRSIHEETSVSSLFV